MSGVGLNNAVKSIMSANGTAQYLIFAWWTMIFSGMLVNMHTHEIFLFLLLACGLFVYYAAIYECKKVIKRGILATTFVLIGLCADFIWGSIHDHGTLFQDIRHITYMGGFWSLCFHGFYLSYLLTRQILEERRMFGRESCR